MWASRGAATPLEGSPLTPSSLEHNDPTGALGAPGSPCAPRTQQRGPGTWSQEALGQGLQILCFIIPRAELRRTANKQSKTRLCGQVPQCFLCPSLPERAVRTGQQVVEDIERGLAGRASGHT